MKVSLSGTYWDNNTPHEWPAVHTEGDVPDEEGARLCAHGMAEPVAMAESVEKAVAPEPEKRGPGRPRKPAANKE
jgi:hypothetical protein